MAKKKRSRIKGILSENETQFLYLTETEKKKFYGEGSRKKYERIVNSANKSFQDFSVLIAKLPKQYREKIEFVTGLRHMSQNLDRIGDSEQIPHYIIDTTLENLKKCKEIIKKQHSYQLEQIANDDFDKVEKWLLMTQKYPKPTGADI